jgi:hypothetical protein
MGRCRGVRASVAWTPAWYTLLRPARSFNSHTCYFTGYDGQPYFCQ